MLKFFSIFFLVLFYFTIAFGQAAVDLPVVVHDNAGLSITIYFGLDLAATDGIDESLGESELPPPLPGNAFDARWWIPPFNGSIATYNDYRAPGDPPAFPYSEWKQHEIKFQTTDFPITISWNLPATIHDSSYIKDPFDLQIKSFSGADSMVITLSAIPYVEVHVRYNDITPVELTSFTAVVSDEGVMLNWITATELNNQGFDVERKSNTKGNWERLGYVPGYGTTTEPQTYSYLDENVPNGSYSYRLRQIDFSGTYEYSDEIIVNVGFNPTEFVLFQNYPNPFNPTTSIQFQVLKAGIVNVKIYDMLGQEIKTLFNNEVEAGMYTIQWDGLNDNGMKMSSGSYIYRMTAGDFVDSKEMILLK